MHKRMSSHAHSDHIGGILQIVNEGLVDSNTKYYYRVYEETLEDTNQPSWDNRGYYDRAIAALRSKTNNLIDVTNNTDVNITVGYFNIKLLNTESWSARGNTGINPNENLNSIVEYVTIIEKIPNTLKTSNKFILLLGILLLICGAFIIKKVIKKET